MIRSIFNYFLIFFVLYQYSAIKLNEEPFLWIYNTYLNNEMNLNVTGSYRLKKIPLNKLSINNSLYEESGWWNKDGWARGLHRINPMRMKYYLHFILKHYKYKQNIKNTIIDERDLYSTERFTIGDIGCGGGILTNVLAKSLNKLNVKTKIKAIDPSKKSIHEAMQHNINNWLYDIDYRIGSIYKLPFDDNSIDVIILSDVLDHLNDLPAAMKEVDRVLKHDGIVIFGTITRSLMSRIKICYLAELIGIIPKNTHDYNLFITPKEIEYLFSKYHLEMTDLSALKITWKFTARKLEFDINKIFFNTLGNTKVTEGLHIDKVEDLYLGKAIKTI